MASTAMQQLGNPFATPLSGRSGQTVITLLPPHCSATVRTVTPGWYALRREKTMLAPDASHKTTGATIGRPCFPFAGRTGGRRLPQGR